MAEKTPDNPTGLDPVVFEPVLDPEVRTQDAPPKVVRGDNGYPVGTGPTCPFCTHPVNAHRDDCPIVGGDGEYGSFHNYSKGNG